MNQQQQTESQKNDQRKKLKPVAIFLIVSMLAHICFWLSLFEVPERKSSLPENVEVSYVSPNDAAHLRQLQQIVVQKNQINDELDPNAKYLSAFNQKIIKQTRADKVGKFNNDVAGGAASQGTKEAKDVKKQTKKVAKGELPELKDLLPTFAPQVGKSGQMAQKAGDPTQSDDYLRDVQKGLQTMLSTREFVYYSYYSRIKEQISQYWEPNVREKVKIVYRQGRSIASSHDRVTQLMITLDSRGQLLRVEVITASGVHDLDDAAVEAFRSAAPFPNPPKGMVESDGTIKIRWDFILEA
jgi:TonB family protein